jgi:tRNA dimethylallyltransferase
LLAVIGPTGAGKTALAIELAETLGGELIGCDALQIYRRFDVGTAKPSAEERARVPHHLVDELDPEDDFTLARFVRRAEQVIESVCARGAQPIVVGGTGMYLRGLLHGIVPAPRVDPALRRRIREMQERRGETAMHRWLQRIDPASAARLEPGDRQRVGRALEWWCVSRTRWSERLEMQGTWAVQEERYRCLKLGLDADREWLRPRLEQRVERFFAAGLVEEVRSLLDSGVSPKCNAFQAIGYREVAQALRGGDAMGPVIDRVKINTRRYAKRQRTWFRKEPGVVWLDASASRTTLRAAALDAWARFKRQTVI